MLPVATTHKIIMYTKEKLKELGFEEQKDGNVGIIDFVKKVSDNVHLVLSPMMEELFIWIIDNNAFDPDVNGTKILLDTSDLKQAISLCEIIVGVDDGF